MEHLSTTSWTSRTVFICFDKPCVHKSGGGRSRLHTLCCIPTQQSRASLPKSVALYPKAFSVANVTVDLLVGSITSNPGVEEPQAGAALETLLVPHLTLGKDLICMIDKTVASWAAFALWGLQAFSCLFVLPILNGVLGAVLHLVTRVCVESSRPSAISVTLGTKLAPVTGLAEEASLTLITESAVKPLVTHRALEASLVPLMAPSNLLFSSEHRLGTSRA